jgi:hypothetical protein
LPEGMATARSRVCEAARFHALLLEEADSLLERWREAGDTPGRGERTGRGGRGGRGTRVAASA